MSTTRVYIGLGSNLGNPIEQIELAVAELRAMPCCCVVAMSSLYGSKPMGPQDQPDYVNAVMAIDTSLSPEVLLDQLQMIEVDAGRVRKAERWGARILDLDILLYGDLIQTTERLTLPHYGLKQREFVLIPLAEIAPELVLPDGDNVIALSRTIALNGLAKLR